MAARPKKKASECAYHVDYNKRLDRWDVVDDAGRVISHRHEVAEATHLAIREAQHQHGSDDNVVVCVEQTDGTYKLAWVSRSK